MLAPFESSPTWRGRSYSLKTSLTALVLLCVVPPVAISAWLLWDNYQFKLSRAEEQTMGLARDVAAAFDQELASIETALKVLATAPELMREDLAGFHQRAREALIAGSVYNYILTDRNGRMVMNTLVPYGKPLPTSGTPPQLAAVFTTGNTVLTDFFIGPVTGKPALAMGVPVRIQGEVKYSLNIGLSPDRLNQKLNDFKLTNGWLIAVLDQAGTIVARSRDAQRFVGQKAVPPLVEALPQKSETHLRIPTKENIPTFASLKQIGKWRWGVVIGMHRSILRDQLLPQVWFVLAITLAALLLSLLGAAKLAGRVLTTVRNINQSAKSIHTGERIYLPEIQFKEAEAVGSALAKAGAAMQEMTFRAQHDPLTGLANRLLFTENAKRNLALAQRNGQELAVLAIDLDNFKLVNDIDGHAAGDQVLIEAARRIERAVRSSDLVARLGGDEFLVLLTETNTSHARQTADRIVSALAKPYPMTAQAVAGSVGIALYPADSQTLQGLIHAADHAMYEAKAEGRRQAS